MKAVHPIQPAPIPRTTPICEGCNAEPAVHDLDIGGVTFRLGAQCTLGPARLAVVA